MRFPVKPTVALLFVLLLAYPSFPQALTTPDREQLLNGLRLMLWLNPGSQDVTLKLRINSGAAFDLSGKSGQMALLGDLLFPDPATVDYFTDEMGGKLDVSVNYDSITITMVGKASELERIVEVLRNALLATQLTPDVVARMKGARLKLLRDASVVPATVADRAIAARLFGDFPYARPTAGSPEDLARVDHADLMQARDRFLNSNNATLAIIGGVTKPRAMKTVRQLLGPWRKSEQIVPTTFRQPTPPDPRALIVNVPGPSVEVRLAVRGVSRSDPDYYVANVLAKLAQQRWMNTPATADELERAKHEAVNEIAAFVAKPENAPDPWLDADTYRLRETQDQIASLRSVTASDIQRVANRLFKTTAVATVLAGETLQLKPALEGRLPYEVLGEIVSPTPPAKPPTKPASNNNPM
jgi:predicted Zn-dependent peptidase